MACRCGSSTRRDRTIAIRKPLLASPTCGCGEQGGGAPECGVGAATTRQRRSKSKCMARAASRASTRVGAPPRRMPVCFCRVISKAPLSKTLSQPTAAPPTIASRLSLRRSTKSSGSWQVVDTAAASCMGDSGPQPVRGASGAQACGAVQRRAHGCTPHGQACADTCRKHVLHLPLGLPPGPEPAHLAAAAGRPCARRPV